MTGAASLAGGAAWAPRVFDADRADTVAGGLDAALTSGPLGDLIRGAAGSSPHLARLLTRHAAWLAGRAQDPAQDVFADLLGDIAAAPDGAKGFADIAQALRVAKARAALLIALADLGGLWDLGQITGALSRLADQAIETGARWLIAQERAAGRLPDDDDPLAGYVLLAMGKLGAHELNYSSDIDLIALFNEDRFAEDQTQEVRARFIHVTRQMVKLLSESRGEGYVFRTDLRLRPNPSTTPVCVGMIAAERYYEAAGRTWERAAMIKARPLGDRVSGQAFLQTLAPFVWRRHLDFAAIEDVHDLLRKIRAQRAGTAAGKGVPGTNVKLDPGGIREIEFFAQTRQLIMGGRDPALRPPGTRDALAALAAAGIVDRETAEALSADYVALRTVEHRLQMVEDQQTHQMPTAEPARDRLAALAGWSDRAAFEDDLAERMDRVHRLIEPFFASEPRAKAAQAPDADPMAAFERQDDARRIIGRWRDGDIPATRTERARALYRGLEPLILHRLADAGSPDHALAQLDRFLSGLPAGVQLFSLFSANPQLLDLIVSLLAAAPRMAAYLARHSQVLDALLDRDFFEPLPPVEALTADLTARLAAEPDYERQLDLTRRWGREHWFRAGVHVLRSISDAREAGAAFARIAEASVTALLPRVIDQFARRHGRPPGNGLAVVAMGRLGSREMTAGSDLDLITIYDPGAAETSDGDKPLTPQLYYPRLTQMLIAALTAPTAEGALYEVDMRLRPSGSQGPVAVSLASFESYQLGQAWVWEHLALTRARVIAGPAELCEAIRRIAGDALAGRAGQDHVLAEARAMRARLIDAHAKDRRSPWSLKHAAGGLMEIEFVAQTGVLYHGLSGCRQVSEALPKLAEAGWLTADEAAALAVAHDLQSRLQHVERVAVEGSVEPEEAGAALRAVLVDAGGAADFADLERLLHERQAAAAAIADRLLPPPDEGDAEGGAGT